MACQVNCSVSVLLCLYPLVKLFPWNLSTWPQDYLLTCALSAWLNILQHVRTKPAQSRNWKQQMSQKMIHSFATQPCVGKFLTESPAVNYWYCSIIACSHRRHGHDKVVLSCLVWSISVLWTVFSCPCRCYYWTDSVCICSTLAVNWRWAAVRPRKPRCRVSWHAATWRPWRVCLQTTSESHWSASSNKN